MFRLLKWLLIVAVVAGSMHWFVKRQADERITQLVAEANAKMPMKLDADTTATKIEFSDHVLRYSAELTGNRQDDPQRNARFHATLLAAYCSGAQKAFYLAGISEEYTFRWDASDGPKTAVVSVSPADCTGAAAVAATPGTPDPSPQADLNDQQRAERLKALTTGKPLEVQPLTADEQRRALAGNQQCINGFVVEYTSATHTFAQLGPPAIPCTDRMATVPLR